jgi:hypothetical protein
MKSAGKPKAKNAVAQALVAMRNRKLSPERRKQIAAKAAAARWAGHEKQER